MGKPIMRYESIHSLQGFAAKFIHNYRATDVPNADKSKLSQNRFLISMPAGETYNTKFEKDVMSLPYYQNHKLRKNGVLGYEFMFSYGTTDLPANFDLNKWCDATTKWLKDQFGEKNVVSAVLHMDETTPHIHAIVFPVNEKGRLSGCSFLFKDRTTSSLAQQSYYECVKDLGLTAPSRKMQIEHEEIRKFYGNINLALAKELPAPEHGETLPQYANRMNEFYKDQTLRVFQNENQLDMLKKRNKALEKANQTLSRENDQLKENIEQEKKHLKKEIGSIANAKHAIKYRDDIQSTLEWYRTQNPELAASTENVLNNMILNHLRAMENDKEQTEPQR